MRKEVILFAEEMERQLAANDDKGGWKVCKTEGLLKALERHLEAVRRHLAVYNASGHGDYVAYSTPIEDLPALRRLLLDDCVDVANLALMIADVCGALKERAVKQSKERKVEDG